VKEFYVKCCLSFYPDVVVRGKDEVLKDLKTLELVVYTPPAESIVMDLVFDVIRKSEELKNLGVCITSMAPVVTEEPNV
jgi:hypothetical protein